MRSNDPALIDEELHRLEVGIRQLKVQYDMFFAGGLATEPAQLRFEVEKTIKRCTEMRISKYAQRFRFNSLVSRFNRFAGLWAKTVRAMEEGDYRTPGVAERIGLKERLVTRCVVGDPSRDTEELRRVHEQYLQASRRAGRREVPFDRFVRGISAQTERLRERTGCGQIELRLVVSDGEVHLKARPGR